MTQKSNKSIKVEKRNVKIALKKRSTTFEELIHQMGESFNKVQKYCDILGIDLSQPEKIPDRILSDPFLSELFLDNKFIEKKLEIFLRIVKIYQVMIHIVIDIEKKVGASVTNEYVKIFVERNTNLLQASESILNKFEHEKYFSKRKLAKYRNKIQILKDQTLSTTREQNLGV